MSGWGRAAKPRERARRGRWAEDLVAEYLQAQGLVILARNVRLGRGELDLVVRDGSSVVFVEVRSRREGGRYSPEASLSRQKKRRLISAATVWLARSGLEEVSCRFDLVAVRIGTRGARLKHYRGAFVDDE